MLLEVCGLSSHDTPSHCGITLVEVIKFHEYKPKIFVLPGQWTGSEQISSQTYLPLSSIKLKMHTFIMHTFVTHTFLN